MQKTGVINSQRGSAARPVWHRCDVRSCGSAGDDVLTWKQADGRAVTPGLFWGIYSHNDQAEMNSHNEVLSL